MIGLTIVLPTYNRRHVLERTIGHYQDLARRWPLLVVDDGSHDGTANWLAGLGVPVLRVPHRGLPAARNAGLHTATTPWVLFGEDDVLMPATTPERLLQHALRLPQCGAVAPVLHTTFDWILPNAPPMRQAGPLHDLDRLGVAIDAAITRPQAMPIVHACALVDRASALSIGGYDSAFAGSHFREESDFYARVWRSGRSVWLVPDAWAVHVRHRLGGGCRSQHGMISFISNRCSYWSNDARYADRHARMWRVWNGEANPGTIKARAAVKLARNLWDQAWRRLGHP